VLGLLTDFVDELRRGGLPVSPDEVIDAAGALAAVGLADRAVVRESLRACLVKSVAQRPVFDGLFELYFSRAAVPAPLGAADGDGSAARGAGGAGEGVPGGLHEHGGIAPPLDRDELAAIVLAALRSGDDAEMAQAARLAVALLAGIEAGRPVGVSYYVQRTLRAVDTDGLLAQLLEAAVRPLADDGAPGGAVALDPPDRLALLAGDLGPLGSRLVEEEYRDRIERLVAAIEAEVRRVLSAERGVEAVAASLRRPLVEDVDFMHASLDELAAMRRSLVPLTRVLAARLARRRRHRRAGPLDFRSTVRHSLSSGGVPIELRFRHRRVSKPELVVLADVSGSVASFARFTLMLLAAIAGQFSAVRSFLFIDGVDEVTGAFRRCGRRPEALEAAVRHADVVASDGHSDYGRAFGAFAERYGRSVGPRTTVLVLGDARNNYHAAGTEQLEELHRRARHLYWLNPEPRAYWGSGDSIIGAYARHCDEVFECRNLRQLGAFVDHLA
jgi:uncharacterized protein with von Willebrand factor type A (vWA) domain